MEYIAHKTPDNRIQIVKEHSKATAKRGEKDACFMRMEKLYRLTALLHDMGKNTQLSCEYQKTVGSGEVWKKGTVVHSNCGGKYIYERFVRKEPNKSNSDVFLAEIISTVIMSHHGLFDFYSPKVGNNSNTFLNKINNDNYDYEECKKVTFREIINENEITTLFSDAKKELLNFVKLFSANGKRPKVKEAYFNFSMLTRMILSILINSDHSDTAEFVNQTIIKDFCGDSLLWGKCCNYFEEKIKDFDKSTELNAIRSEISDKAYNFSKNPASIVRMTVPTGGGKTLSALRYAINHAKVFNKSRIFYVAPFNSILGQNYKTIKEYLPNDVAVLPHFGDVISFKNDENTEQQPLRCLTENWGSPVITTSMVQFLNSLFDGRINSIRKMRGLINSVIILDEIQSIPVSCITLFNRAVEFLAKACRCTIVLCTATQPPFDKLKHGITINDECEMIGDFEYYSRVMRRTRIIDKTRDTPYSFDETADFLYSLSENNKSILCIVNTKKTAYSVYTSVKKLLEFENKMNKFKLFHLSANMCPKHRDEVIEQMKSGIKEGKRVICVSTQIIEAGVDISFDTAVRSIAGIGSIIQSAGRCNRNKEKAVGDVYIINIEDENTSRIKEISKGIRITASTLSAMKKNPLLYNGDILSPKAISDFYIDYYNEFEIEKDFLVNDPQADIKTTIFNMLSTNPDAACLKRKKDNMETTMLKQAFKTAGEYFEAISDDTMAVIVPYGYGKKIISELLSDGNKDYKKLIKEAQNYSVGLHRSFENEAFIKRDEITGILFLADGYYDDACGFTETPNFNFNDYYN